ncbi:MAG: CrcB protein [Francisellaceae bacterium]|jgi:CrcB protein
MFNLLVILLGGGLGAVSRFLLAGYVYHHLGKAFPYGILACNIIGSLVIGFSAILFLQKFPGASIWQSAVITGFLGGFTTFSSFSLDTITLIQEGFITKAVLYIVLSVGISLVALVIGMYIGKLV